MASVSPATPRPTQQCQDARLIWRVRWNDHVCVWAGRYERLKPTRRTERAAVSIFATSALTSLQALGDPQAASAPSRAPGVHQFAKRPPAGKEDMTCAFLVLARGRKALPKSLGVLEALSA